MNILTSLNRCIKNYSKCFIVSIATLLSLCIVTSATAQSISTGNITDLTAFDTNIQQIKIKVSADGSKATAVWLGRLSGFNIIESASATIVGKVATWSSVNTLSVTGGGRNMLEVDLALSSDGTKAIAAWSLYNGVSGNDVEIATASISGNAATWSAPAVISLTHTAVSPRIGLSSDGTLATAVWREVTSGHKLIRSSSATISGNVATWGAVSDLSDASQDAESAQIALSSDGQTAIANWTRSDGTNTIIQSAPADINGTTATWGAVTNLSEAGQNAEANEIAIAADGSRATSSWRRSNSSNVIFQSSSATLSSNTASWSAVTDISASGQSATTSNFGLNADASKGVFTWSRSDGSNTVVQARAATFSGNAVSLGATTTLSATGKDALIPRVLLSSDGSKAVLVWSRFNASDIGVAQGSAAILDGTSAVWGATLDISDGSFTTGVAPFGLSSDGLMASFALMAMNGSTAKPQAISAQIAYETPTPTPIATPTATSTTTPTPTPTPIGVPFAGSPKLKAAVKKNTIKVTIQESAKTKAITHYAYVLIESDYSLFKKVKIPTRNGAGSITIKKVPAGVYRVFVVTKRSVKPKTVETSAKVVTVL